MVRKDRMMTPNAPVASHNGPDQDGDGGDGGGGSGEAQTMAPAGTATSAATTSAPAKRPIPRKKVVRQPQLNVNERPRRQIKHKYIRNLLYTGGPSNHNGNIESPGVVDDADAEAAAAEAPVATTAQKLSPTSSDRTIDTSADQNDAAGLSSSSATAQQQLATLKRKRGRPKKVPAIVASPVVVETEPLPLPSPSPSSAQCPISSASPHHSSESSDAPAQLLYVIDDDDSASVELIEIVPSPVTEEDFDETAGQSLEVANATITVDSEQFELLVVEDDSHSPVQPEDLNGILVQQESDDCYVVTVGTDSPSIEAADTNGDNEFVVELGESVDVVCVADECGEEQPVNVSSEVVDVAGFDKSVSLDCDTAYSTLNSSCNSNGGSDMDSADRHPFNMSVVRKIVANLDGITLLELPSTSRPRSPKVSKVAKTKNPPINVTSELRRVTRRNSILFAPGPANQSKALAKLLGTTKATAKARQKMNSLTHQLPNEGEAHMNNGQTTAAEHLLPVSRAASRNDSPNDADESASVNIDASFSGSFDLTGDDSQTGSSVTSVDLQDVTFCSPSRMPEPCVSSIELTPNLLPALDEELPDNPTVRIISSLAPITAEESQDGESAQQPATNCSDKSSVDVADVVEVLGEVFVTATPLGSAVYAETMPIAPEPQMEELLRAVTPAASKSATDFRLPKTLPEKAESHKLTAQTNGIPSPKSNEAKREKRTDHRRPSVRSKSSSRMPVKKTTVEVESDPHTISTADEKRSRESTPQTHRLHSEKKIAGKAVVVDASALETSTPLKLAEIAESLPTLPKPPTKFAASSSSAETKPSEIRAPKPVQEKIPTHKPAARMNGFVLPKPSISGTSKDAKPVKRSEQRRESVSAPSKTVSRAPPKKPAVEEKFDPYAILSKCYMPKQVKHDASLYSIEAQRAARAKEADAKAEAEAVRRDAVAASAAADSKPNYSWMSNGAAKIAPPSSPATIVDKAEIKLDEESAVPDCKTEPNPNEDDREPAPSAAVLTEEAKSLKVEIDDTKADPAIQTVQQPPDEPIASTTTSTSKSAALKAVSEESHKSPKDGDEDASNTRRRSGRIKIISETKQQSRGTGLVRNRDRVHNTMSAIDADASGENATVSPQAFTTDGDGVNSQSHPAASPSDTYSPRSEYLRSISPASLERHQRDVREGLGLFKQIVDNEFRSERNISKEARRMTCDCFLTAAEVARGEYGCGEDCLNRLLMIECGSRCVVAERCTNKRFQRHQTSECTIFKTEKKGFGLRALRNIRAGDFIMEYVGEVLNAEQFEQRAAEYAQEKNRHHYFMALRSDCVIDATLRGNISRFINHSCDPNAETQKWTVNGELRIGFFCAKDIAAGDEITFDYQFQRYGKAAQRCYCEAELCRGWIGEEPESDDEVEEDDEDDAETADEITALKSPISPYQDVDMPKLAAMAAVDAGAAAQIAATAASQLAALVSAPTTTPASSSKSSKSAVGRKPARLIKPKRLAKTPKRAEIMEDPDLDMHIDILTRSQLKNQAQTLRFSRLMVRAKLRSAKSQLLCLLRSGELACRRLFLDYHGLKLLHAWMCDEAKDGSGLQDSSCGWDFRLEILQTLAVLPIPNKLMLEDSKVLQTVREWSKISLQPETPAAGAAATPAATIDIPKLLLGENTDLFQGIGLDALKQIITTNEENAKRLSVVAANREQSTDLKLSSTETAATTPTAAPAIDKDLREIVPLAKRLITDWKQLPEVFRIPKRQRIEQMKEHEREANRNYRALGYTDDKDEVLANRRNMERFRERERDQPPQSAPPVQQQQQPPLQRYIRPIDRYPAAASAAFAASSGSSSSSGESSASLKMHRRQQFEAKVAAEQLAAEQQHMHEMKCNFFHLDAKRTDESMVPLGVNPYTTQWYGVYGQPVATPPSHVHIKPPVPKHTTDLADFDLPRVELPDHWKSAVDARGSIYYYHAKIRIPQWVPPIKLQPLAEGGRQQQLQQSELGSGAATSATMTMVGLGDESSSDEDDAGNGSDEELLLKIQEVEQLIVEQRKPFDAPMPLTAGHSQMDADCMYDPVALQEAAESTMSTILPYKQRKNRPLLVTERCISPCTEEDRQLLRAEMRRYRENKDKMRNRRRRNRSKSVSNTSAASKTINNANDEDDDDDDDDDTINADEDRRDAGEGGDGVAGAVVDLEEVDATTFADSSGVGATASVENDDDGEKTRKLKRSALRDPDDSEESDDELVAVDTSDDAARRLATKRGASEIDAEEQSQLDRSLIKRKKHATDASDTPPQQPPSNPSTSASTATLTQPESSEMAARRIKDKFRTNIAGVIVHNLTQYRRTDCPVGHIRNDDDFRHLAKKLTHFVMLKELKHCANTVHALEVTDSVRSKAKEFVRKYMTKFGAVYKRGDNEPEYKNVAGVLP